MSANIKQTFYDFCIETHRQDLLSLWDYELNNKTPKEVGSNESVKYWFKCSRGIHESQLQYLCSFYQNPTMKIKCKKCNSIAQYLIDTYSEDGFKYKWSNKNTLNPWEISRGNSKVTIWLVCDKNPKHIYNQYPCNTIKDTGCPYCSGKKVLPEESVGALYPNIIDIWSDKNKKSPYEYTCGSGKKVWIKCINGVHDDYLRTIKDIVNGRCGCSQCSRYSTGYPEDLTGIRFGRLVVVRRDDKVTNDRQRWLCLCDCQINEENPQLKSIDRGHLTSGKIISCGCYIREACSGANNWNWKGGISSESEKIRSSIEYRKWQKAVHKRDQYTCQCCGKKYDDICTHHIFSFSQYEDLRFNVDNGICLCKDCHNPSNKDSFHAVYGTRYNTPEQLREYILNKTNKDIYELHPEILQLINTYQNDFQE